jgi:hypothetical protein
MSRLATNNPSVRVTRDAGSGQHLASVLQEGRENTNIDAGLGFIWRISALNGHLGGISAYRGAQLMSCWSKWHEP